MPLFEAKFAALAPYCKVVLAPLANFGINPTFKPPLSNRPAFNKRPTPLFATLAIIPSFSKRADFFDAFHTFLYPAMPVSKLATAKV
ncbi:MAG: hypothetical protein JW847_05675 [Candidatus Omnitrophica bacterium]|nr:hypothetical protein [Candidatus Omnitrophota bacterium]